MKMLSPLRAVAAQQTGRRQPPRVNPLVDIRAQASFEEPHLPIPGVTMEHRVYLEVGALTAVPEGSSAAKAQAVAGVRRLIADALYREVADDVRDLRSAVWRAHVETQDYQTRRQLEDVDRALSTLLDRLEGEGDLS